jgi:hypothetical protein
MNDCCGASTDCRTTTALFCVVRYICYFQVPIIQSLRPNSTTVEGNEAILNLVLEGKALNFLNDLLQIKPNIYNEKIYLRILLNSML